jgi:high frequency lysogenization protein
MRDRTIALAGLMQAIRLVHQMANTGQAETRPLEACIASLFRFDAEDAEAVYGDRRQLQSGVRLLLDQLVGTGRDHSHTRMAVSVLGLERRFLASADTVAAVHAALERLAPECERLGAAHPDLLARLGEVYAERISPLGQRVLVQGNPVYLAQPPVVAEVRATLLAALRAAVLWRQLGGSYWDFLFARGRLANEAKQLLA